MKLFEYAILYKGKKDKDGEWTKKAAIIKPPTCILANDDKQAAIMAAREIPQEYTEELSEVDILIRPF